MNTTLQSVQEISAPFRAGLLDKLGIAAILEHELRNFAQGAGLGCVCNLRKAPIVISAPTATVLFRIFQEALMNVAQHARASEVRVRLVREPSRLLFEVSDDGCGISEEQSADPQTPGLLGMHERAHLLGGKLTLFQNIPAGTTVRLTFPFAFR